MGRIDRKTGLSNVHGIVSDARAWPILRVTPPPYHVSDQALLEYLDFHSRLVASMATPYALVLDLRSSAPMSAAQRRTMTHVMNRSHDALAATCRGTALVFSSSVLRGMLSAVFWLFRPPYPVSVMPDVESATAWAAQRVGVSLGELRRSA